MAEEKQELFETTPEEITLHGIDTAVQFTRFKPQKPKQFLGGIILSQDLKNEDVVLYTKGTEISADRMNRLVRMGESNTKLKLSFSIRRTPELMETFREEILQRIRLRFEPRLKHKVFKDFSAAVAEDLYPLMDEIFGDDNFTLAVYRMKFLARMSKAERAAEYFDHSLKLSTFALAVLATEQYRPALWNEKTKKIEIMKAALIHNYEVFSALDTVLEKPETVRQKAYWDVIRKGYFVLGAFNMGFEVMDALRIMSEYYLGEMKALGHKDVVDKSDWPKTMANILIVLDMYLQKESGFYESKVSPRRAIDLLNVLAAEKRLNEQAVAALTLALNFRDIFEFYRELDVLLQQCPSKAAWPYPLTGFKSPTLFICSGKCPECEHMQQSGNAVNLLQPMRDLKVGEYKRCNLLTPKLIQFYKEHYDEIKKETKEHGASPDKE